MYSSFELAFKYLNYYVTASNGNGHGMHSPFVFDFINRILNDKENNGDCERIEKLRKKIKQDESILTIEDYGAGSSSGGTHQRTVGSVAKRALKSKKYSQLLYRIVSHYQPDTIIELGTSLGITTAYLAMANPAATIITLEGASSIANIAKEHFKKLNLENINLVGGNFDYTLPAVLYPLRRVDLAFIDGNHRRDPTENYFHWLLEKSGPQSIFIFDDIHWSREMEQAWGSIKLHPSVKCSIDLFFLGIVFFREEFIEKQHFCIRF